MMKIIVAQKHMNLASLIVVTFSAIGLISCGNKPSKLVAAPQLGNSGRTFADWCRQKADLSPEAKHTVEELLKIAGTTECDAADRKLSSLPGLGLIDDHKISDIKPLESLTNLTVLILIGNKISDIKPLESLTNLTVLNLDSNQIRDIKPLQSLTKLTRLHIRGNPIAPKTCPLKPESICKWEPEPKP